MFKHMFHYTYFVMFLCFPSLVQDVTGFSLKEGITSKISFNVTGLMPAVFTALNEDQTVNLDEIPAYADYLVKKGIYSVLVGGTSGEHVLLRTSERMKVIAAWVKASRGRLHVQAQVGGAPFADVIALASHSARVGVDSILTLPDVYFKPKTVEDLVDYVGMVAKAVPHLPVFYYHIPKITNVLINMPAFVKAATASIPNFKGLKFTSIDLVEADQVLKVLFDDQQIMLGGERLLAPGALLGIKTFVSPGINLFPWLIETMIYAVESGDVVQARSIQDVLPSLIDSISEEGGRIPALKMATEILTGLKMGPPVLPRKPVTSENKKRIKDILRDWIGDEEDRKVTREDDI